MRVAVLLALAVRPVGGASHSAAAPSTWDPASLHLFVDTASLTEISGLALKAHRPDKTFELAVAPSEPWDGGGTMMGLIEGYSSVVQVSADEIRIYYVRRLSAAITLTPRPQRWLIV